MEPSGGDRDLRGDVGIYPAPSNVRIQIENSMIIVESSPGRHPSASSIEPPGRFAGEIAHFRTKFTQAGMIDLRVSTNIITQWCSSDRVWFKSVAIEIDNATSARFAV